MRPAPIPPAGEPMQFRAIGLIRGRYCPGESFTCGFIETDSGERIEAVILGKALSLVRNHVDLAQAHLWVVYPRTRPRPPHLHLQVVGLWEPETLQVPRSAANGGPRPPAPPRLNMSENYFSIRGEVVAQNDRRQQLAIKIQQRPRPGETEARDFRVEIQGQLPNPALQEFWEVEAERQGDRLLLRQAKRVKAMGPRRRSEAEHPAPRPGRHRSQSPHRETPQPEVSSRSERPAPPKPVRVPPSDSQ